PGAPGDIHAPATLDAACFRSGVGLAVAEHRRGEHADPVVQFVIGASQSVVAGGRYGQIVRGVVVGPGAHGSLMPAARGIGFGPCAEGVYAGRLKAGREQRAIAIAVDVERGVGRIERVRVAEYRGHGLWREVLQVGARTGVTAETAAPDVRVVPQVPVPGAIALERLFAGVQ